MEALEQLLVLQEIDIDLVRLQRQLRELPERASLTEAEEVELVLRRELEASRSARQVRLQAEAKLSDETSQLADKMHHVEHQLETGAGNHRELLAWQADLDQLRRQRDHLDDLNLVQMEARETIETTIAAQTADLERAGAKVAGATTALAEREVALEADLEALQVRRRDAAGAIDESLLKTYERIRTHNRGVGVAKLVGNTCQGCHLTLPAVEVDRIRALPADAIARCDNCSCILVRT
ncbi:MAG: hypothetical protein KDB86_11355 [Actinobacteria bacterium]|nr:hypothetical protein [Actinomycetota bacterium]MCB9388985.1 hypothetical protein [Acidimicrobiia bacterium]